MPQTRWSRSPRRVFAARRALVAVGLLLLGPTLLADTTVAAPGGAPSGPTDFDAVVAQLDAREEKLTAELEAIGPEIELIDKRVVARGRAYYRSVRAGLLPVGGGFDSLVDHAAAVERLRAALLRDVERKAKLEARQREIAVQLKRIRVERAPLTIQQQAMKRAATAMQQAEERNAAFMAAFGGQGTSSHVAVYGAQGGPRAVGGRFADLRGRLAFPLTGRSEITYPHDPTYEGAVLLVGSGDSPVRAVFSGHVAWVGKSPHGTTLVLDHGDRYFTVYGQLGHVDVKAGDRVPEGARIGWILRHAGQQPLLHFEVRRGEKLLDAAAWLGI